MWNSSSQPHLTVNHTWPLQNMKTFPFWLPVWPFKLIHNTHCTITIETSKSVTLAKFGRSRQFTVKCNWKQLEYHPETGWYSGTSSEPSRGGLGEFFSWNRGFVITKTSMKRTWAEGPKWLLYGGAIFASYKCDFSLVYCRVLRCKD